MSSPSLRGLWNECRATMRGLERWRCCMAFFSSAFLAFGLYHVHSVSGITEGGVLGATLLLDHWFSLSPAVSGFVLNLLCYGWGWRLLGRSFIAYSLIATVGFSLPYKLYELFPPLWPQLAEMPLLASVEESEEIDGLLILLNTVGGDIEAGLAIAELAAGMTKPVVTLVLGGGHSIGIPLAVAARHSFIVPTATMTVHPVRHSGMVLGVPQTLRYFEQMQERIVSFVTEHSKITARRFTQLMHNTGELVMDMGTVLDGRQAVEEGLIDELGGLRDALGYLYKEIEK